MKAGSSGLVGENDLLIVGPGVLGRIVAEKWREVVYYYCLTSLKMWNFLCFRCGFGIIFGGYVLELWKFNFFLLIGLVLHSCTGFWEFFDMGVVVVLRRCLLALVVKCVCVLEYNGQMADELAQMAPHLPVVFDQLQHVKLSLF